MTDDQTAPGATPQAAQDEMSLPLILRAQYTRDLSFENPNPIAAFTLDAENQPGISVNVQAKAQDLGERNFEVVLDIRVDAKMKDEPLFIAELSYGGIVTIGTVVADEDLSHFIMVETPHLLFPFARNIIADMVRNGNYPPFLMPPVNFAALFQQQQNQQNAAATQH